MNRPNEHAFTLPGTDIDDPGDPSLRLSGLFEKAWDETPIGGEPPRIEDYLENAPSDVRELLREMLSAIDRRRRGQTEAISDGAATMGMTIVPDARETLAMTGVTMPPKGFAAKDIAATAAFSGSDLARTLGETLEQTQPPRTHHGGLETMVDIFVSPSLGKPPAFKMFEIAEYEILDELGRGGMGVVYKARQKRLDRVVALKMVLSGAHASAEQLARFQIEAQAVAQLHDPGIVQIFEVGEHEGLPFFSLEYVEGISLAKRIGGKPTKPKEAAETVRDISFAMNVAHKRGIIHRDLKPANILLNLDNRPKITDFGLAKRIEGDSGQTRSGAIMGTPSYMAPEQALGKNEDVGPLSDQYALGAILYEMLTGRPPFQGASILETLELARTQEPVPPSRLQPNTPADLETICLKALQKDPKKRYETTERLAEDLRHFLNGEPIVARPVSTYERAWRWCARNQKIAGLIAAVVFLLISVTAISSVAAVSLDRKNGQLAVANDKERNAREVAQKNEAMAVAAKREAVLAEKRAIAAKDEAIVARNKETESRKKVEKAAAGLREQIKPVLVSQRFLSVLINLRLREIPGTQKLREELLEVAVKNLRDNMNVMESLGDITRDQEGEAVALRTLAGLNQSFGRLMEEIGKYDDAARYFKRMDELADQLEKRDPKAVEPKKVKAASLNTLGDHYFLRLGDAETALKYHERALEYRRKWLEMEPRNDNAKDGVANTLGAIARVWLRLGVPEKAREIYREELSLRDQFTHDFSQVLEIRRERTGLLEKLGDLYAALGDREEAGKVLKESLNLREELDAENPGNYPIRRDVQLSQRKLGMLRLLQYNDPPGARAFFDEELRAFLADLENDPSSVLVQEDAALAHYDVALAALRQGDRATAENQFQACLSIREKLAVNAKSKVTQMDLMVALAHCGKYEQAAKIADELTAKPPQDSQVYYAAACGYAICAGAVDRSGESDAGKTLARKYVDACYRCLRAALGRGWKEVTSVETDPDLDPIRKDPGFAEVLKEFREAAKR